MGEGEEEEEGTSRKVRLDKPDSHTVEFFVRYGLKWFQNIPALFVFQCLGFCVV